MWYIFIIILVSKKNYLIFGDFYFRAGRIIVTPLLDEVEDRALDEGIRGGFRKLHFSPGELIVLLSLS